MSIIRPRGIIGGAFSLKDRWFSARIGDYRLGRGITASHNSWTCEATKSGSSEKVFLKVAHYTSNDSLEREAVLLGKNISPGFPRLVETGRSGLYRYLAMELIRGDSLDKIIKSPRSMTIDECLPIIIRSCAIFADLHAAGYLCRDFKLDHLILQPDGVVRATDLGMAVEMGYQYRTGELHPALNCAPEERKRLALNERTDIHALGRVLSGFLIREVTVAGLRASSQGQKLEAILTATIAPEPENRPAKLLEVLAELKKI